MKTEVKIALIGATATVIAALIAVLNGAFHIKSESKGDEASPFVQATTQSGNAIAIHGTQNTVTLPNPSKVGSNVKLVDVIFDENEEQFPTIDIKVRNTGDEPSFIKKVVFSVSEVFVPKEYRNISFKKQNVTWKYDVVFDGNPGSFEKNVSQVVPPHGTDRFTFKLAQDISPPEMSILARFRLKIVYDESDKEVVSENLIVSIPRAIKVSSSFCPSINEDIRLWNIKKIEEFSELSGKRSLWAQEQFEQIEEMKHHDK